MKKLVLAALAATTAIASPAAAQQFGTSNTDSTTITATIALVCTINAPTGGAVLVNAETPIGDSAAQCNDPDGFTATLSSANAGVLEGADSNNATTIPYVLNIAGVGSFPLTSNVVLPRTPGDQAAVDGISFATSVTVGTPNGPAFADSYSDTITYSIVPN